MTNNAIIDYLKHNHILTPDLRLCIKYKKILNSNPDIIQKIIDHTSFLKYSACIKTRIHCIIREVKEQPLCKKCGKLVKMRLDGIYRYTFPDYCCSKCFSNVNTIKEKRKLTNLTKYGAVSFLVSENGQEQKKQTNLKKYGFENAFQNEKVQEKQKETNLKKYNNEHFNNREKAKQTTQDRYGVENPLQNEDIRNQIKQTMLEKYGVDNLFKDQSYIKQKRVESLGVEYPLQSDVCKKKFTNTMLEKYGVEHAHQLKGFRDKYTNTMLEKYGVEHAHQLKGFRDKYTNTMLEKYGVEHHNQQHMKDILPLVEDYNWLHEQYIEQNKTTSQIAVELGIDGTTVCNYLRRAEIGIRQTVLYSYRSIIWLESIMESENIHIQHALNGGEYQIPGTRLKVDGYCEATNTIYEFHGDYWHGNPLVYAPDAINEVIHKSMGELYQNTIDREEVIKAMGYKLVVKWESNF